MSTISRVKYFGWAAKKRALAHEPETCPGCQSPDTILIRRKYLVTSLHECRTCGLRFRMPKDDPFDAEKFYSSETYHQQGFTELPTDIVLDRLKSSNFAGTEKDFSYRIRAIEAAGVKPGARVLDYGSSWGYGSWQMARAGFTVISYEIGQQRSKFAREKLDCTMIDNLSCLQNSVDCFFSSHVIEHLPDPAGLFQLATELLAPGGVFLCYCPNGAVARERRDYKMYNRQWNQVHPLLITPEYLTWEARKRGFKASAVLTAPFSDDDIRAWRTNQLDGDELLFIARL